MDHPGIVDVFEFGRLPDGTTFLVMEFLKGKSLRALLKQEGKLTVHHALRVTRQVASALAAAHDKGIIHRDRFTAPSGGVQSFQKWSAAMHLCWKDSAYLVIEALFEAAAGLGSSSAQVHAELHALLRASDTSAWSVA